MAGAGLGLAREKLFVKQAAEYAKSRPTYPKELFSFIFKHVPGRMLAWDVGTGNGQAAVTLSDNFEKVIATDVSEEQIKYAQSRPNIAYLVTQASMSPLEAQKFVGTSAGSLDLITVAQAMHWFNLPQFYTTVKHLLRPRQGVLAAWLYKEPTVNSQVDNVCQEFYTEAEAFWDPAKNIIDDEYRNISFPFNTCDGSDSTGPFQFWGEKEMSYDLFVSYIRSWSPYQTAKSKGVDLLDSDRAHRLLQAWGGDSHSVKNVKFPIFLRLGRND